jgi:DNA-binding SARP family transcriptional activator/tetratricopeptide (TPR) repeat protein
MGGLGGTEPAEDEFARAGEVGSRLEIRVLGPVAIAWDGRVVDIGGAKARALVARLLIDRHIVVSVDRLVDSLWGDHDGQGAEIALRSTISRVRKRLRDAGAPGDLIVTRAPGYVLDAPADVTDANRFEQLVAEGRRQLSRRRPSEATRLLTEAQGLWRGQAYSEVRDEPFARAEARRLDELFLAATETRIDAELTLGRHEGLIGELESLTSAHPMRERLWSQRMLALYRCGRQAEALRVFQDLRSILVAELGIDPGHDVTWMEHAVLTQEAGLDFPVPPERDDETMGDTPAADPRGRYRFRTQATANESPFVGRSQESAVLRHWWGSVGAGEGRLLLVDGDPGIGKTRLVLELARAVDAGGALVLWGRCDEDPVTPFQPFAEALSRYFQSLSADRISRMPDWQLTELSRLVLRLNEYVPSLEEEAGDAEPGRYRFFEAVTATLDELSERRATLLVLDDLHRADQPTLLLLRHVLGSIGEAKFGIIGIYNDTEVPQNHRLRSMLVDFRSVHPVETVHLQGLGRSAVEELTKSWPEVPADLVPRLCQMTDGNPLFLDEMLRQLRYERDGADTPVPPNLNPTEAIRELVARRVSRLPEDVIYLLQAAAVAGHQCEAGIVAEAAGLTPGQGLDAFDRAEESRLLRRVGDEVQDRYAFSHALVRDAIYGELLRGRRARYHHQIAAATERAHADALDSHVNELALHYSMGAALADADKAVHYCTAAGERALRLLAFEEAVVHFTRGLDVAEQSGSRDSAFRCDTLVALAEAQGKIGDVARANENLAAAVSLARAMGDAERLATAALRAGPLGDLGIGGANLEQVQSLEEARALLEEARAALPPDDSHLRSMVTARLGLVPIYSTGVPAPGVLEHSLALNTEAVAMARRLGDRNALGYALNARLHALWGIESAPERLATGKELGEVADDVGDEFLALHGHMWRVRELLAQGDVDAVIDEVARSASREAGPVHPLDTSHGHNIAAMLALIAGDFERGESLGGQALDAAAGYNELAGGFNAALMIWTWWQRDELGSQPSTLRQALAHAPEDSPSVRAGFALAQAEAGEAETALAGLDRLSEIGWENVGHRSEAFTLALAAAAGSIGSSAGDQALRIYEQMRPYAGTAIVVRPPAAGCLGPADTYLGMLAEAGGDLALAEVHFEAALRLARRMRSAPFAAAAEVELARTLRRRGRDEGERVAVLLRGAEESALRMGLRRLARRAAEPG